MQKLNVHIRWMIRRDMPEVLQIEQDNFDPAWTEADFLERLRERNCIGMIAEHGDMIMAFMTYELHKSKLHLTNFAVHAGFHRCSIGKQLITKLIDKLSPDRRTRITCEVRETNLNAQLFLKAMGFRAVRVIKNFFEDFNEDAYLMLYKLPVKVEESKVVSVEDDLD